VAVFRLAVECDARDVEIALAGCYARGAFSIEEQDLPGGRVRLLAYFGEPVDGAEPVDESIDWQSVSEQPWVPVELGERLWLAPPWLEGDAPPGRVRLDYLRGQACGTGGHAATQVCLEAIDKYLRPGDSFLDVGVGSGILSIAAARLGAGRIAGCDIDFPSAEIARANCAAPIFVGSVRSVRDASFDLVAANINATTLETIGGDLRRILKPGGILIGGGFRADETPRLPLLTRQRFDRDGWSAIAWGGMVGPTELESVTSTVSR
jgi:ribosomal protein L11 methyltransferase